MTDIITSFPKRPNWTNRQRIAAADLKAEQDWQDAQLSRLRRLALGWGVVAGLEVEGFGNQLRIKPGYGITAAGSEIYLGGEADVKEVFENFCKACGGTENACGDPKPNSENGPITGWLVLKPAILESCPRPTVPEGCSHPGSDFAYSRKGAGVEIGFLCELPERLWRQEPDCARLESYLGTVPVLVPGIDDDVLPIAQITVLSGSVRSIDMDGRQRLLPLWALQGILGCCECHDAEQEPPVDPPVVIETPWDKPSDEPIGTLVETIADALPGGDKDFELTFQEIFAEEGSLLSWESKTKAASLVTKSFAASLLVMDEAMLSSLEAGDFDAVFSGKEGLRLKSKLPDWAGGELAKMPLGEAWESGETNYHMVVEQFGDLTVGQLKNMSATEIGKQFGLDPMLVAPLYWLQQRATTILRFS